MTELQKIIKEVFTEFEYDDEHFITTPKVIELEKLLLEKVGQIEPPVKVQIADFVKDLIRLLDGEYAPSFDSIPDKYKEDFKGWANEIKQQEWEHNWQKAWQIYNREYIVYYLQNLEC